MLPFDPLITPAGQYAALGIARDDLGGPMPPAWSFDPVSTVGQIGLDVRAKLFFQSNFKWIALTERIGAGPKGPSGHLRDRLNVESAIDERSRHLEAPLRLPIAAGRSANDNGTARFVLNREADQRVHGPFARRVDIGRGRIERKPAAHPPPLRCRRHWTRTG